MPEPTLLHLIRHGAYDGLGQRLMGQTPGISLNEEGRHQADSIALALGERPLRALIVTPLQRTEETAAPLAKRLGIATRIEGDLTDLDYGAWTGLVFTELEQDARWHAFNRRRGDGIIPGGESMIEAQNRAVAAIARLSREFDGEEVALFTHGDVIRAALLHYLGMSLNRIHEIEILPGSRSLVSFRAETASVLAINLPPAAPA
jgi:probable phosphoglycerate mutase